MGEKSKYESKWAECLAEMRKLQQKEKAKKQCRKRTLMHRPIFSSDDVKIYKNYTKEEFEDWQLAVWWD